MVYNTTATKYEFGHVMDKIRPTEVEGYFGLFFGHVQLRPPHVDTRREFLELFDENVCF